MPPPRGMKMRMLGKSGQCYHTLRYRLVLFTQMDKADHSAVQVENQSLRLSQKQRRRQILRKKKARSYFGKKERLQRKLEAIGKEKENVENKVVIRHQKNEALKRYG